MQGGDQQDRISRIELLIGIAESTRLGPKKARELLELVRESLLEEFKLGEQNVMGKIEDGIRKKFVGC